MVSLVQNESLLLRLQMFCERTISVYFSPFVVTKKNQKARRRGRGRGRARACVRQRQRRRLQSERERRIVNRQQGVSLFRCFSPSSSSFGRVELERGKKEVMISGGVLSSSKLVRGSSLCASSSVPSVSRQQRQFQSFSVLCRAEAETETERFRLNNLSPAPGSKREKKRIGRGYGAGQGGSAGKGMRGQNARSGGGTRPGFEGGQNPLYRR